MSGTARRSIGVDTDFTDKTAKKYTGTVDASVKAAFDLLGGRLQNVGGSANAITGELQVPDGFTAYTDGLAAEFLAAATNTGSCTIDIESLGPKALTDAAGQALDPGEIVTGNMISVVFVAAGDHFRLRSSGGVQNVTVQGGLTVKRGEARRTLAALGPTDELVTVVSDNFQAAYASSRVIAKGCVTIETAAGTDDDAGLVVELWVGGASAVSLIGKSWAERVFTVPFDFTHLPGDTVSHIYEIKVSSTNDAVYSVGSAQMVCEEWGLNP